MKKIMKFSAVNANISLDYTNKPIDMKARIINKSLSSLSIQCNSVNELLKRYGEEYLPEHKDLIRSSTHLFTTHLPLCLLYHVMYEQDFINQVNPVDYDLLKLFLFEVCESTYPLKGTLL